MFNKIAVEASEPCEVLLDFNSGRVLYSSNENNKKLIASTTKILTCITAIENCDLNKKIIIKSEWCNIEGSSVYLKENEEYTLEQLLYGLMLRSGNDCAVAIACSVSGTINSFVALMNETAYRAGALQSNFENPHGLDSDNHYSTAYDLALITRYALNNEIFKKIVSTKSYSINKGGEYVCWVNKNKLLSKYEYAIGVKTGYTKKSGRCLVSACDKKGQILICVVLDCYDTYDRSIELFNMGYEKYENAKLFSKDESVGCLTLKNNVKIPVYVDEDVYYPLTIEVQEKIRYNIIFDKNIDFPLKFNQKVGLIQIYLEKQLLFEKKIYTII